MVCSSGIGFDPLIGDTRYTFEVSGLYNGLFVMTDDQTGSTWTHYDGTVLQGPLAGTGVELELLPLIHTTWEDWRADHPESLVPVWETGFEHRYNEVVPGTGGLSGRFEETLLVEDDRLAVNELVLGVSLGGDDAAYVFADLAGPTAIHEELAGRPVVVFLDPDTETGLAYCASVDGEVLEFTATADGWASNDGTTWSIDGEAVAGPRTGDRLSYVTSFVTEWYGWVAYHPDTTIHGETGG